MTSTARKRERELQKVERARVKAERRADRQASSVPAAEADVRTESQLIEELAGLHHALEAGNVTPEDFERRRDQLQEEMRQIWSGGDRK